MLSTLVPILLALYSHLTTLSSSGSSASTTVSVKWVALQCHGGTGRFKFGSGAQTAVNNQGLSVFADQPPVLVEMTGNATTVAMIRDSASTGTVTCDVLDATQNG